jgi:hypothetical protein
VSSQGLSYKTPPDPDFRCGFADSELINLRGHELCTVGDRGPYSFRSDDRNGLVHMLTETFQRDTGDQASFGMSLA